MRLGEQDITNKKKQASPIHSWKCGWPQPHRLEANHLTKDINAEIKELHITFYTLSGIALCKTESDCQDIRMMTT